MAPNVLADEQALYALAKGYPEAFLFVGYSEKALFESVDGAVEAISPYLQAAEKRCSGKDSDNAQCIISWWSRDGCLWTCKPVEVVWKGRCHKSCGFYAETMTHGTHDMGGSTACFASDLPAGLTLHEVYKPFLMVYGGDPAHVPTIGAVVKALQQKHKCHVLAMQASGKHEDWVDHVFICQEQFEVVKKLVDGKEVEVKETLWGGTRNGVPVGGARYYMGPEFYGRPADNVPGAITLTFFLGGGGIAAEELQFADEYGAPWIYIPCPAKNVAAYGGRFGPVHDYVVKKLSSGDGKHLALFGNRPAQS